MKTQESTRPTWNQAPYCAACIYGINATGCITTLHKGMTPRMRGFCTHAFAKWFDANLTAHRAERASTREV